MPVGDMKGVPDSFIVFNVVFVNIANSLFKGSKFEPFQSFNFKIQYFDVKKSFQSLKIKKAPKSFPYQTQGHMVNFKVDLNS